MKFRQTLQRTRARVASSALLYAGLTECRSWPFCLADFTRLPSRKERKWGVTTMPGKEFWTGAITNLSRPPRAISKTRVTAAFGAATPSTILPRQRERFCGAAVLQRMIVVAITEDPMKLTNTRPSHQKAHAGRSKAAAAGPQSKQATHRCSVEPTQGVNAGEILQWLAGVKVQHGLSRFIPEGQPPTAVLTVLGVTGAWSERA